MKPNVRDLAVPALNNCKTVRVAEVNSALLAGNAAHADLSMVKTENRNLNSCA